MYGAIDAVVASDAVEVPLNDLRDGVAMLTIELVQVVDGDVEEVVVHMLGSYGCGWRLLGAERRRQQEEQEEPSHIGTIAASLWNGGWRSGRILIGDSNQWSFGRM